MTDADEVVREVHTSEGCKVTIKSKRGSGTRDQDEVKAEVSATSPDEVGTVADQAVGAVEHAMAKRRGGQEGEGQ